MLSFFADHIEDRIHEFGSLGVMSLGPVVSCPGLPEDVVVWTEELAIWSGSDRIHRSWFQIHQDSSELAFTFEKNEQVKLTLGHICWKMLHCSRQRFFRVGGQNPRHRLPRDRSRARQKSLPRISIQSGCRIGRLERERFLSFFN